MAGEPVTSAAGSAKKSSGVKSHAALPFLRFKDKGNLGCQDSFSCPIHNQPLGSAVIRRKP